jgi:hypothetical protein
MIGSDIALYYVDPMLTTYLFDYLSQSKPNLVSVIQTLLGRKAESEQDSGWPWSQRTMESGCVWSPTKDPLGEGYVLG